MLDVSKAAIEAPFDSDDYPKSVLLGEDIADAYCDTCLRPAQTWSNRFGAPAAMFQAAIYCPDCMPLAYDEYTGVRVATETGLPPVHSGPDYCYCPVCSA